MAHSNDPRKKPPRPGAKTYASPGARTASRLKPARKPQEPAPAPVALADRILDNTSGLQARASIDLILKAMDAAGAKQVPLSNELVAALPVVAAKAMTHKSIRANLKGADLGVKLLKNNRENIDTANRIDQDKTAPTINIQSNGQTTFIIPAPVIAKLGDTPEPRR